MTPPSPNGQPPTLPYWRVYVDAQGVSHQERATIDHFQAQSMGGAAAQWNAPCPRRPEHALFSVLPAGWVGEWHENPAPQWILALSGGWFVETMDGHRVEFGPGDLCFGGDQHCTPDVQGRKGHRSGTLGDAPAVLMLVQMPEAAD